MDVKYFLISFYIYNLLITVKTKEICPGFCICDVFEGLKRADCRLKFKFH